LFMVHVPQEMNLDQAAREELIGKLVREAMENTPQEQRRAYMFQPQTVFTMQAFMEKVLETEGITKEMVERQQKQVELLQTLATADSDVVDFLMKDRSGEIDETFFAMLHSFVERASQMNDNKQLLPLINLQAKLMVETAVGRKLEKRQVAIHHLNRDAKKQNALTPEILLKHVLKNHEDMETVNAMVQMGANALTYEFFTDLTAEIDRRAMAGEQTAVSQLTTLRTHLLELQKAMQDASQKIVEDAQQTLKTLLAAPDIEVALRENAQKIDDAFMYVLSAATEQAEQQGETERLQALSALHSRIMSRMEQQSPPEIQLLSALVQAETEADRVKLLDEQAELISPDLLKVLDALVQQVAQSGQMDVDGRLQEVKKLITDRL
ncbi:MAG: hypothetical protein KAG66_09435, partial [Methylococcales bacterium]|nr:hypothetical protein [Methylococcales bacterium]